MILLYAHTHTQAHRQISLNARLMLRSTEYFETEKFPVTGTLGAFDDGKHQCVISLLKVLPWIVGRMKVYGIRSNVHHSISPATFISLTRSCARIVCRWAIGAIFSCGELEHNRNVKTCQMFDIHYQEFNYLKAKMQLPNRYLLTDILGSSDVSTLAPMHPYTPARERETYL